MKLILFLIILFIILFSAIIISSHLEIKNIAKQLGGTYHLMGLFSGKIDLPPIEYEISKEQLDKQWYEAKFYDENGNKIDCLELELDKRTYKNNCNETIKIGNITF